MKNLFRIATGMLICWVVGPPCATGECCIAPDNGTGTIDFPADCPYDDPGHPVLITGGLPAETTLELAGPLEGFTNVTNVPGGTLGGEICTFVAQFTWDVHGTGDLEGFHRIILVPVMGEIHIGPRAPGDSLQAFATDLFRLTGSVFGDPDFCSLQFTAGSDSGYPGPGEATLTWLPNGDFEVDSFFDLAYRLEFEGCLGSPLDGLGGSTTHTVTRFTCFTEQGLPPDRSIHDRSSTLVLAPGTPNPFDSWTNLVYGIPAGANGAEVVLRILDAEGRVVRSLVNAPQPAGVHSASWNGVDRAGNRVAGGVYICELTVGRQTLTRRIVYAK